MAAKEIHRGPGGDPVPCVRMRLDELDVEFKTLESRLSALERQLGGDLRKMVLNLRQQPGNAASRESIECGYACMLSLFHAFLGTLRSVRQGDGDTPKRVAGQFRKIERIAAKISSALAA